MPTSTSQPCRDAPLLREGRDSGHSKVLVVDDERINREILRGILRRQGIGAILADSGPEAIRVLESSVVDLVLLDVVMEPMNGFEVLRAIRNRFSDTELPVVMVTAEADRDTIIAAFRQGANDYVTKPLDPEVALARVGLHLRLRQSQVELQRSEERYMLAAQGSRIGLWDWDITQQKLFLSDRWKEMLGFNRQESPGDHNDWTERVHPGDRNAFLSLLRRREPLSQERFECELRMRHRDETYRWMNCTGIVQSDAQGCPIRMAGSLADITDGKVRDALTGLPNRLLFEERLESAVRRATMTGLDYAVLFLDLDKFKLVNDSIGHDAGDLLLCSVARRLEHILVDPESRAFNVDSAIAARHGGDEFTVLLEGLSHRQQAERVARRIIDSLSEPYRLGRSEAVIGCSIGITYGRSVPSLPADLLREADTAMYYAKTSGRGQYRTYDPAMQARAAERLALEGEVRHALKAEEFYVVYQPIVRVGTGVITGFEALCRWRHPRGEKVGPDVFVPILESLGLIGELGQFVLRDAGRQVMEWNRLLRPPRPLTVTVNCSTREFSQPAFQRDLLTRIEQMGIDPQSLRLEVTESTLMENPESVRQFIGQLRDHGVGVALDDFGTGYSSLSYLHRLPLDQLKIDKSFVRPLRRGNESYEIVRTIVSLATGLDLAVVAEGVETEEQHQLLLELGCSHVQGYLYGQPADADDMTLRLLDSVVDKTPVDRPRALVPLARATESVSVG